MKVIIKKYKKFFYILISAVSISFGVMEVVQYFKSIGYHNEIPISCTISNIPLIEVEIEKKKYPVIIDLGSNSPLELNFEIIKK